MGSSPRSTQPPKFHQLCRSLGNAASVAAQRILVLTCLVWFAGVLVWAAGTPSRIPQGPSGEAAPEDTPERLPDGTIRRRVALVDAPVVVTDSSGQPILDLEKSAFRLRDNGVEQMIEAIDLGGEPLSAVLVFQTSARIGPWLPAVSKSATIFTQTIVGPSGEAAILSYDSTSEHLQPFTSDHDAIEKTISSLKAGANGARLYDTLSEAVVLLSDRPSERRRAIIVIGEAKDDRSEVKLGKVLRQAQLANIVIYSVGLSPMAAGIRAEPSQVSPTQATPPGTFVGPPFPGSVQTPTTQQQYGGNINLLALAESAVSNVKATVKGHALQVAAAATGGTFQSVTRDRSLEKAVDAIGGELNSQYILSYRVTGSNLAGYHRIDVTVDRPGTQVRARPGYYLEAK